MSEKRMEIGTIGVVMPNRNFQVTLKALEGDRVIALNQHRKPKEWRPGVVKAVQAYFTGEKLHVNYLILLEGSSIPQWLTSEEIKPDGGESELEKKAKFFSAPGVDWHQIIFHLNHDVEGGWALADALTKALNEQSAPAEQPGTEGEG